MGRIASKADIARTRMNLDRVRRKFNEIKSQNSTKVSKYRTDNKNGITVNAINTTGEYVPPFMCVRLGAGDETQDFNPLHFEYPDNILDDPEWTLYGITITGSDDNKYSLVQITGRFTVAVLADPDYPIYAGDLLYPIYAIDGISDGLGLLTNRISVDTSISFIPTPVCRALADAGEDTFFLDCLSIGCNKVFSEIGMFEFLTITEYDYITAVEFDGTNYGKEVKIALPYMLRKTPFDGLERDGIGYTYTSAYERTAEDVVTEATEDQVIVPNYVEGDIITAVRNIERGTGVVDENDAVVEWLDTNNDGRAWAEV